MTWVETNSLSFAARHDADQAGEASRLLERLEAFRAGLASELPALPDEVAVVIHPRPFMLSLAHPWLPLARIAAAPASRRYMAGWFTAREIHVLSAATLADRASSVPGSREALVLSPEHEYAHLALGRSNRLLPPPFTPASFARYLRWAWLAEGAATWLSGQTPHLRPALARRLREGPRPDFPPATKDSFLLGGTVFDLLEQGAGREACIALALRLEPDGPMAALERAFMRDASEIERDWLAHLDELA
ncbi:MAG: hypothetical protein H0T15_08695 [Thermoleophilaceae bacterium]|nr:hypothetical protein [Thermoleophilaceae bacterium]